MLTDMNRAAPKDLSQDAHRRLIGVLGLLLPLLVWLFAGFLPTRDLERWELLGSISAYWYTGAVGVFVGVLFALSLFLFTYRGYEGVRADRIVGAIGGAGALGVALIPTGPPGKLPEPVWWSEPVGVLHYVAAAVLFSAFMVFSIWLFRKSAIPARRDRPAEKRRRDDICLVCGIVIGICMLWALLTPEGEPIFWPEAIAVEAFAVSWLTKGKAHRPVLRAVRRLKR